MAAKSRPLADLLTRKQADGLPYREMSRIAQAKGHPVSHSHLASLAKGEVAKAPYGDEIKALAAATGEPERVILHAVLAEFYGFVPAELDTIAGKLATVVPPNTPEDRLPELFALIEAWLATRGATE